MKKQTIVWTALPKSNDGPLAAGSDLHLSVYLSPRLWNSDPNVTSMQLSAFQDFLDWPAAITGATFQVEFESGPTLDAVVENVNLRSDLWKGLFKPATTVRPFVFEDLTGTQILTFPATKIHDTIKKVFQRAATDASYGAGKDLPGRIVLAEDPDLNAIARPTRPPEPYQPPELDRGPVVVGKPKKPKPGPCCCWGCLLLPIILVRRLLKLLGFIATFPLAGFSPGGRFYHPNGGGGGGVNPQYAAFQQLNNYLKPHRLESIPLPTQSEVEEQYDFHSMIAALGDYPNLMRYLGLVVDLKVTLDANLPPANGTIKVIPTLNLQMVTTHSSPRTHYELGDQRFITQPRPANPEIKNGLLRLHDATRFQVMQMDTAGEGTKLANTATNLVAVEAFGTVSPNTPEEAGLPAMRTSGISIVRPEFKSQLIQLFVNSYALNLALAVQDGSPTPPMESGDPAPAPKDDLYAEDVVRGYRIDVFDDQLNKWHSLCQRVGDYHLQDAPDSPGGEIMLQGEEDEGFVQMGVTEPLGEEEGEERQLRTHESLFTWDGWSLSAPRPGKTLLDDAAHSPGTVANEAKTQFNMEVSFIAKAKSLARLRFGYKYRLRARVVDLAGNSVFSPGDQAFNDIQTEVTLNFMFRRFEPVSPPALMQRAAPKEGESLERLVVRSEFDHLPPANDPELNTERHIIPPKTSQLMAERHGLFDGPVGKMLTDQAAFQLASREAATLTDKVDFNTMNLVQMAGIQNIGTTEQPLWLQTNKEYILSYLPDPLARGVLLLGLPGMANFEQIIEPDGGVVNKIPFEGAWPDLTPFRLHLTGIGKNIVPAQPAWDAVNRVLTVQIPQGETVLIRFSCYFHAEDLEKKSLWQWTEEAAPPNLVELRDQTIAGRSWLHAPFRELLLIHAVQQPLEVPKINKLITNTADLSQPDRKIGETSEILQGEVKVDAKSTAKLDLQAFWEDPVDKLDEPAFVLQSHDMQVGEIQVQDPKNDLVAINSLTHVLGDTKYHRVKYSFTATTRYREFFSSAITADPNSLIRPTQAESLTPAADIAKIELDIYNAARPDAPNLVYLLPTFHWSETINNDLIQRIRRSAGVRVYMERPWYSSGAGELLGVVLVPLALNVDDQVAETLKKYTSEWGMDPLWPASRTAPLALNNFHSFEEQKSNLSLAELPGVDVQVLGYEPGYDAGRKLWYCDVLLDPGQTYFPFVRLALVRFQPNSVKDAHLSRVVQADFIQIVPHREINYDLGQLSSATPLVDIEVKGPSYLYREHEQQGSPIIMAALQRRVYEGMNDELGWEAIPGASIILLPDSQAKEETIWKGTIDAPTPQPHPLRIMVVEFELFRSADEAINLDNVMAALTHSMARSAEDEEGMIIIPDLPEGLRVSFFDAIEIP